ncbi:hypothetical protein [Helicobacter sp. MIT 05-5294]|uniref:hypothetical protein n=1 Tax=Helicobacter sp. MIT 05-5294 TaxID=1548150 RepID=UPI000AA90681|nr:hypothetical protein [Helicobacter sp. MIT 05-5294]
MKKLREDYLDFLEEYYLKANDSALKAQDKEQESDENLILLDDLKLKTKEGLLEGAESQIESLNLEEKEEVWEMDFNSKEISFRFVCLVLACMFVALLLFIPKVYICNNIYYVSRNLIQLQAQLDSLNEENKYIKKQLEDIKFKNLTYELNF